jgi:hypothetical protein
VAKKDIKLDVDHNVITISAKRSSQKGTTPQKTSAESDTDAEVRCLHHVVFALRMENRYLATKQLIVIVTNSEAWCPHTVK